MHQLFLQLTSYAYMHALLDVCCTNAGKTFCPTGTVIGTLIGATLTGLEQVQYTELEEKPISPCPWLPMHFNMLA